MEVAAAIQDIVAAERQAQQLPKQQPHLQPAGAGRAAAAAGGGGSGGGYPTAAAAAAAAAGGAAGQEAASIRSADAEAVLAHTQRARAQSGSAAPLPSHEAAFDTGRRQAVAAGGRVIASMARVAATLSQLD